MPLKAKNLTKAVVTLWLCASGAALLFGCKPAVTPPTETTAFTLDLGTLNLPDSPALRTPEQIAALFEATSYAALVMEEGVRIRDYEGPDDDYYTKVKTITAKVLETYRGESLNYIDFEWALEAADNIETRPHPYIITLCQRDGIYYRQEIAADINLSLETIAVARKLSKDLDPQQTAFSDCD